MCGKVARNTIKIRDNDTLDKAVNQVFLDGIKQSSPGVQSLNWVSIQNIYTVLTCMASQIYPLVTRSVLCDSSFVCTTTKNCEKCTPTPRNQHFQQLKHCQASQKNP